ncbi:MAG: ATP-binding cassette domain-containing protein [Acidimicrobiales bacterium]|nr:ATP-binding cassette domain-containing protein [Acidimicrobiales bacterium]
MTERLIECVGLSAGYGSMAVVRDLDLHVAAGEVVALLGANGAGKTTTLLTLAGELPPIAGEVRLDGVPTSAPMHVRCRQGLSFLTEKRSVIMGLTARENLRLADVDPAVAAGLFPALGPVMARTAGLLSGGEQQMLSLARALGRDPRVLLADELSLGLAPKIVEQTYAALAQLREAGTALLVIEQHVSHALALCDRVAVLDHGTVSWTGPTSEAGDRVRAFLEVGTAG